MRLLLDTHVFLWWLDGGVRLPPDMRSAIEEPASAVFVSAVSIREIAIKASVGKLVLPASCPPGSTARSTLADSANYRSRHATPRSVRCRSIMPMHSTGC